MGNIKTWEQQQTECIQVAENKGYTLLGLAEEYKGSTTKLKLSCSKHGVWETASISAFKSGTGCPVCAGPLKWEDTLSELQPIAENKGFKILGYIGEYKGVTTKLRLVCPTHGEWISTSIAAFKKSNSGCPKCNVRCKLNWEEELPILQTKAKEQDLVVLGYVEWKGSRSVLKLSCIHHTEYEGTMNINNFKSNGATCPFCSGSQKAWQQQKEEIEEMFKVTGYKLLGLRGKFSGRITKVGVLCDKGHETEKTVAAILQQKGSGCLECWNQRRSDAQREDEAVLVDRYLATGIYTPGTILSRVKGEINSQGYETLWSIYCPVCANDEYSKAGLCDGVFKSHQGNLGKSLSCRCSNNPNYTEEQWGYKLKKEFENSDYIFDGLAGPAHSQQTLYYICTEHGRQTTKVYSFLRGHGCPGCAGQNQRELYINFIKDESGEMYAAKLGISNNSDRRIKDQNRVNNHTMQRALLFLFGTPKECRDTESYLKQHVPSIGYVPDLHMQDGSTETFALEDLDYVVQTIKQRGGVLQEENYVS